MQLQQLVDSINQIQTKGRFAASGVVAGAPLLAIDGVGTLSLPVVPLLLPHLRGAGTDAPYGRGADTIVDASVRRCTQIDVERVSVPVDFANALRKVTQAAAQALGVDGVVSAHLYKLLVYGPGDFFAPHRDTEKEDGMFGTLVVTLPCEGSGGDLVVRHGEDEERVVWNAGSTAVHWAAFYSDCVHEIEPLTQGIRVALVYNLVRRGGAVGAPDDSSEVARLAGLMKEWGTVPLKLVYVLDHSYTPAECGWNGLKGIDQGRAAAVRAAAARAGVDVYLAQLSVEQSWSAETVYYKSSQRSRYMNRVPDEPELYDLIEDTRQLHGWIDVNGDPVDMEPLPIVNDDDEIVPEGLVDNEPPDEQRYLEATGNEGATVERTYRRTALVMWPARHRWRMVAARGAGAVADGLQGMDSKDMVGSLVAAAREEHCLRTWSPDVVRVLGSLVSMGCVDLAAQVIDEISFGYLYDLEGVAGLLPHMEEALAAQMAAKLMRATPSHRIVLVAELLGLCRTSADERELWTPVLDVAAESLSLHAVPPELSLPTIIDAAWYFGHRKLQKYVDNLLADAATADAVAAAVVELTKAEIHLRDLVIRTRTWLDDVTAIVPEAPTTWKRAPITTCACSHCKETSRFLTSSTEQKAVYPMRLDLRGHVRITLQRESADVDISEQKTGSPHKLVLKKNTAAYERAMARHEARLRLRAVLQSAES